ncbi:MAG: hypothetical protein ABSE47_12510, partial [Acidimicrobiales bacterium]
SSLCRVPKAAPTAPGLPAQVMCGVIAGPLFVSVFTAIGARRPGYDWQRDPVSSLAVEGGVRDEP